MTQLAFHVEPDATTAAGGGAKRDQNSSVPPSPGEGAGPAAAPAPSPALGRIGHTDHDPELIKRCSAVTIWNDRDRGRELCPLSKDGQGMPINWRRWFWDRYREPLEQYLEREGLL